MIREMLPWRSVVAAVATRMNIGFHDCDECDDGNSDSQGDLVMFDGHDESRTKSRLMWLLLKVLVKMMTMMMMIMIMIMIIIIIIIILIVIIIIIILIVIIITIIIISSFILIANSSITVHGRPRR